MAYGSNTLTSKDRRQHPNCSDIKMPQLLKWCVKNKQYHFSQTGSGKVKKKFVRFIIRILINQDISQDNQDN